MEASTNLKSKEERCVLNTVIFSDLYNSSDVSVRYFTIHVLNIQLVTLYTKVCAADRRGNPNASRRHHSFASTKVGT